MVSENDTAQGNPLHAPSGDVRYTSVDFSSLEGFEEAAVAIRGWLSGEDQAGLVLAVDNGTTDPEFVAAQANAIADIRSIASAAGMNNSEVEAIVAAIRSTTNMRDLMRILSEEGMNAIATGSGTKARELVDSIEDLEQEREQLERRRRQAIDEAHNAIDDIFGRGTPEAAENRALFDRMVDPETSPEERARLRERLEENVQEAGGDFGRISRPADTAIQAVNRAAEVREQIESIDSGAARRVIGGGAAPVIERDLPQQALPCSTPANLQDQATPIVLTDMNPSVPSGSQAALPAPSTEPVVQTGLSF